MRVALSIVATFFSIVAGCSGTRVGETGLEEDAGTRNETLTGHEFRSAVDIARGDLSFVDRNFTYRYEALFRPDPLRDDLSDVVFDLAFGLLSAAVSSPPPLIMTWHPTDPVMAVWFGNDAGGATTAMNLALKDRSQPFQCYVAAEARKRIPIDRNTRLGFSIEDVCHDSPRRAMG